MFTVVFLFAIFFYPTEQLPVNSSSFLILYSTDSFGVQEPIAEIPYNDSIIIKTNPYLELIRVNGSRFPYDSCPGFDVKENSLTFGTSKTCYCDKHCMKFNDCCINSPFRTGNNKPNRRVDPSRGTKRFDCRHILGNNITVKATCDPFWTSSNETRRLCEEEPPISDPFRWLPVTNPTSSITYKNAYCVRCNNVNHKLHSQLLTWQIGFGCSDYEEISDLMREDIIKRMTFFHRVNSWGISSKNLCSLLAWPGGPDRAEKFLRRCESDAISDCPPDYKDQQVVKLCKSYQGLLYSQDHGKVYRNAHCALCNGVDVGSLATAFGAYGFSFSGLFDIYNFRGPVGSRCDFDQAFDPYRKVCRPLTCESDNLTLVGGRCVPITKLENTRNVS